MIVQVLTGAIGGLAYSLSGLAAKDKREVFEWSKMWPTIILSAVIGGFAGLTNQDYGIVANSAVAVSVTAIVQKWWKVYRKNK